MSKFVCLVFCIVAASLTKVDAITDEERQAFHEAMEPMILECAAQHDVSEGDISAAKKAGSADAIKSCFLGCVMKKADVLDNKGMFDVEKGLGMLQKYLHSADDIAKYSEIAKQCASVNDQDVSDGEAGCDRAKLVIACALEHKADLL